MPSAYKAENQNWSISQSQDRRIYIANTIGLLEFNGSSWKLYPSPNETIIRSVNVIEERIYTGSYMDFGFWERNELGVLKYVSLSKSLNLELMADEEFWNILHVDDWIVFQSLNRIYLYNSKEDSINIINSEVKIISVYKLDGSIYFQKLGQGIFKLENGKSNLVYDDAIVKEHEIIGMFYNDNSDLLILTNYKGFFTYSNNAFVKWNIKADNLLSENSIYSALQLKDKGFVLGSIADGLICLDVNGNVEYTINQNNGLLNNTILSVYEDVDHNLWLGLDNGISYINIDAPFKRFKDNSGVLGSVYATAIYNNRLYLGTNQGLFFKELDKEDDFKFIDGTEGQVWNLHVIDETLFIGHNSGTFYLNGNQSKKIANTNGTWLVKKINNQTDELLQGTYNGLYVLQKENNVWKLKNKIKGFNNSSRQVEILNDKIFVNHEYKGVFKITVDTTFTQVKEKVLDTLLQGANSSLATYNEDLLFSYREGILKYNKDKGEFEKDSLLSSIYNNNEYISGKLIPDENDNKLWAFTKSDLIYIAPGELTKTPSIKKIPLIADVRNGINEYENILKLNANEYLLGSDSGYFIINGKEFVVDEFEVQIERVVSGENKKNLLEKKIVDINKEGVFKNKEDHIEISFFTSQYNKYLEPQYQYRLEGLYDNWSEWSYESVVFFENLPHGDYTFSVRAKIGDAVSSNVATYAFSVAKPWYISNLMIAAYLIAIALFSMFMHQVYKGYYNKQKDKIIENNKKELELTKIQNEKEIIRIKNKQLQKDIENKSKELAASTMSVVKKNELLTNIREQISKVKDKKAIEPVLKLIDKSLNNHDNWELFKEAFNNADRKFLKKLKKTHPNLSPNDIKLCAYLRLNLSSKEIAPLFNISSRSVEIKRYRLRKKMNLSHEENLVNYILKL